MKLHRLRLHDFRGVSERTVEFGDAGVTVVVGDNETGKSSLLEAFTLLLEYPDDSKHTHVRVVQPAGRDVPTEVEAEFSLGRHEVLYRKRWFRQRLTELRLTEPDGSVETFIGREAHDQAARLFRSEVDETLWTALVVGQEDSLALPAPGAVTAVLTALDEQAGGEVDHGESAPIIEAVEKEYLRYFTPGGRPTGTYSEALRHKEAIAHDVTTAEAAVAQVEHDVSRAESLELERGRLAVLAKDQAEAVAELEMRRRAADELLTRVERLRHEHTLATERLTAARGELERREVLVADLARREQGLVDATEAAKVAAEALRAAEKELAACAKALSSARDEHTAAREHVAGLDARMSRLRDEADLAELTQRLASVQSAQEEERDAAAVLAGNPVDGDVADLAERLHREVLAAQAALTAGAPRLRVRRLGESPVLIDAEPREDDDFEVIAERPTELAVDGVLSVTVHPGEGIGALTAALEEAERSEASLLDELGLPDIAAVRQAARDRHDAERVRLVAQETLLRRLEGTTVEELQRREAVLSKRIKAAGGPIMSSEPDRTRVKAKKAASKRSKRDEPAEEQVAFMFDLPQQQPEPANHDHLMTLDEVRDALARARKAEAVTARQLTEVEHAESLARKGYEGASSGMAAARVRSEQETEHRDDLARALASAREARPDDALAEAVAAAEQHAALLCDDLAAATEEVDESGAGALHRQLDDAVLVRDRLAGEIESLQSELHRLEGVLDQAGKQGLATALEKAKADFAHAERQAEILDRRAAAARLLRETLSRHRAEARRKYSAPLRERIQTLGRALFGPTFDVQLGDDLEVVTRTLDGVALPFADLSTGAREQMVLLVRLAIAGLTAADGSGVPVVLDDALGSSDPGRLRAMGGLLDRAGAASQVIVLTSMPDRYAHIARAATVRL